MKNFFLLAVLFATYLFASPGIASSLFYCNDNTFYVDQEFPPGTRLINGQCVDTGDPGFELFPETEMFFQKGASVYGIFNVAKLYTTGGEVSSQILNVRKGLAVVSGGDVGELLSASSSTSFISGGYVGNLHVTDNSIAHYSGGEVGSVVLSVDGVLNIYGTNFNFAFGVISEGSGLLTGTLADGSSLSLDFNLDPEGAPWDDPGTINLVELEPLPGCGPSGGVPPKCNQLSVVPLPASSWFLLVGILSIVSVGRVRR